MQFINYFFASLISFLGLLIGIMLIRIAPEEQKLLQRYFIFLRKILLSMIFIFVIFYFYNNYFFMILILFFVFLLFIEHKINDLLKKAIIIYSLLGILFFLSSKNINLFTIESSLILLYGLPTASLIYNRKEKNYKVIFYNIGFVIISNLLFFIF